MGGKKKQTVGYMYFTGAHFVLGMGPLDAIIRIKYGDKIAWEGENFGGYLPIIEPYLYGGFDSEGGIIAPITVLMGGATQGVDGYLATYQGANCPAYRGVTSMVFANTYWGTSPYYKSITVRATRIFRAVGGGGQWYVECARIGGTADSGGDMNPVHIIREVLVKFKKVPVTKIDDANFRLAAGTMVSEQFGLSYLWSGETSADEFIQRVLNTIDARLYVHPRTGLYTLKLIRADYDVDDLITLSQSEIKRVEDYRRPLPDELTNSVAVTYWSLAEASNVTVQSDDISAIINAGRVISSNRDYSDGVTREGLATRIAQRDRISASAPVLSATLTCTRAAADLLPGDPFIFEWPQLHDSPLVMRVASMKRGGLLNHRIIIEAIEDVFSLDASALEPTPAEWEDPRTVPLPQAVPFAVEAPYYEHLQRYGVTRTDDFLTSTPDAGMILATAASAPNSINAMVFSDGGQWSTNADLSPSAELTAPMGIADTTLPGAWAVEPAVGTTVQIDDELLEYQGAGVVVRGVLDTLPAAHSAGAIAWAWDRFAVCEEVERAAGEVVDITLQLRNNSRVGLISDPATVTLDARAIRPYPPANVRFNGELFPTAVPAGVDITLEWFGRNRISQADGPLVGFFDGNLTAEVGVTYSIEVRDDTDTVVYSASGIAALTATVPVPAPTATVKLWSVRDGHASWQVFSHTFAVSGDAKITEAGDIRADEFGSTMILE